MKQFKLSIEMLPMGAWNNDFSKTLPKKEWDILRNLCYKRANQQCQICGLETNELDAHEVWEFDVKNKTQTLKDIIGICTKCHGVKHIRNSQRLGYEKETKQHFLSVNKCSELEYASHLAEIKINYGELNKVFRWKIIADLDKFGLKNATIKQRDIPLIKNPYENVDWKDYDFLKYNKKSLYSIKENERYCIEPRVLSIRIDNYQGRIKVISNESNRISWFLDGIKIETKYNVVGEFLTTFKVENLKGKELYFVLYGDGGETKSKTFELIQQEVL